MCLYPSIDLKATGRNIARLRKERGLSVKQLQAYFGFEDPQAIYRWQWGKNLPRWTTCMPSARCSKCP